MPKMIATISCLLALAHAGLGLSFGSQPEPLGEIPVEHTKIVMPGVMPQEVRFVCRFVKLITRLF